MRYAEEGFAVEISDDHPMYEAVRELVLQQLGAASNAQPASREAQKEAVRLSHMRREYVEPLFVECSKKTRRELLVLADRGKLRQTELETLLRISPSQLRARHAGLSKICKRLGLRYPIKSEGGSRDVRCFSLDSSFANILLEWMGPPIIEEP